MDVSRKLLGLGYNNDPYYRDGYYNNSCANRTGCLAGCIIGAIVFFGFAIALVVCLMCRIRRQRRAAQSQTYHPSGPTQQPQAQQYVGSGGAQQYVGSGGAPQYPAPSAYGPGGPTAVAQPTAYGSYPEQQAYNNNAPPTNFADSSSREQWEREQYERYGEAGLVEGRPVNDSGVQMTNTNVK